MLNVLTRDVRDLGANSQSVLVAMLGRMLAEGEQVTVMAFAPHPAPSGDGRRVAAERLIESVNALSDRARHIPARELEALIDEALERARGRRP